MHQESITHHQHTHCCNHQHAHHHPSASEAVAQQHVLIIGDELESILTAVSVAYHSAKNTTVTLLRQSTGLLGGLSTRGGLSYMDLTPEFISPQLGAFLKQVGLKRVALHAETADTHLWQLLNQHGVQVVSGVGKVFPTLNPNTQQLTGVCTKHTEQFVTYPADFVVDTTPDATVARACGVPFLKGLGGVFGSLEPELNTLGVSPVFRLAGVDYQELQAFEAKLRTNEQTPTLLKTLCPWMTDAQRTTLIERSTFAPPEQDYVDILNPIIGLHFHAWQYGTQTPYSAAPYWIDGANIARLPDGTLGFNGLIGRLASLRLQLEASENGLPIPNTFLGVMEDVATFFKEVGGFTTATAIPPAELYIRQTVQLQAKTMVTAKTLFSGGVTAENAVGTFSYWLDFRGVHPWMAYPELHPLPKPVFNVGLESHFPQSHHNSLPNNLAFVSRASGYSPLAQGACRIVQHNALVGEALGIAIAIGLDQGVHPNTVPASLIREHLHNWATVLNEPPPLPPSGKPTWELCPTLNGHPLLEKDVQLADTLQALAPFDSIRRLTSPTDAPDETDEFFDDEP